MSPRAAWRLETLGFSHVYDYVAGKMDWFASGLPREGKQAEVLWAGDRVRRDIPRCRLTDQIGAVRTYVREAGWNLCAVVTDEDIVLGLLRDEALDGDPETAVEQVMEGGPSTFRPSVPLEEMADYLRRHELESALITTSEGKLVGLLERAVAEREIR